jgi:hypothetical protein
MDWTMTQEQLKARIAELEAKLAMANKAKTKLELTDSGYINLHGISGKGRFANSNTIEGWRQIIAMASEITAFLDENEKIANNKLELYRTKKQLDKAVG